LVIEQTDLERVVAAIATVLRGEEH